MRKKKPYAFEPVPGIDTLKGSDDSNDETNEINVESVHSTLSPEGDENILLGSQVSDQCF